jgi:rhamnulose-1-phosphate aldolase
MKNSEIPPELNTIFEEIAEVASYLWQKGWAERNAGNISINVTNYFSDDLLTELNIKQEKLCRPYPALGSKIILVSGTGSRMRDLARTPQKYCCLVVIEKDGKSYRLISYCENTNDLKPTSELPTHLAIHEMFTQTYKNGKVILHTHVNELIALTHIEEFNNEETLNHLLWSMHPESIILNPEGVGLVPYAVTGSEQLAIETLKALKNHTVVIWEKHGTLAIGDSLTNAYDSIDIVAKSATIYFMCKSAGYSPQGMSLEQINALKRKFS